MQHSIRLIIDKLTELKSNINMIIPAALWTLLMSFCALTMVKNEIHNHRIPRLLIVSYDGFRHDYFDRHITPFMNDLRTRGAHASYMRNIFVTKTFPNHHTMATGYYAETHGVVGNKMFNRSTQQTIKIPEMYHYNDNILPIWTINEKSGGNRRTGSVMWPGSVFEYQGTNITFRMDYNASVDWKTRVDTLMSWFTHPKTPINLGLLYIEQPDTTGHIYGIHNEVFNRVLKKLDNITRYLHHQLEVNELSDVNVIHMSDHGMVDITYDKIINITKFTDPSDYNLEGLSPSLQIFVKPGKEEKVYQQLKHASEDHGHFTVYKRQDIPTKYHYANNPRVGDIFVLADVGYAFQTMYEDIKHYMHILNKTVMANSTFGVHGYSNDVMEMQPFFFANGPAFVSECQLEPFDSVDLLPLYCEILEIRCWPTNGTLGHLGHCLSRHHREEIKYKTIYIVGMVVSIVGIIGTFLLYLRKKRKKNNSAKYSMLTEDRILASQLWEEKDFGEDFQWR